jgi:integrase
MSIIAVTDNIVLFVVDNCKLLANCIRSGMLTLRKEFNSSVVAIMMASAAIVAGQQTPVATDEEPHVRRTLATLLQANGASVKATQDMLRHASSRLTMDLYTQSVTADRRAAQAKVVGAVLKASVPECFLIKS